MSEVVSIVAASEIMSADFMNPSWDVIEDIVILTNKRNEIVIFKEQTYTSIDIEKTMKQLLQCTNLLRAAYLAAGSQPCSAAIIKCIAGYQNLVATSEISSGSFISACLAALKLHKMAMKCMEKNPPKTSLALKAFSKCTEHAEAMARISDTLVNETERLIQDTNVALGEANTDKSVEEKKRQEAEVQRQQAETDRAVAAQKAKDHEALRQQEEAKHETLMQKANDAKDSAWRTKCAKTAVLSVVCPPVGLIYGLCASSDGGAVERAQAEKASEVAREAALSLVKDNADLMRAALALEAALRENKTIEQAKVSLYMCIKTLGQIANRFVQMRIFWGKVADHCRRLSRMDQMEMAIEMEDIEEFQEAFTASGKSWAALGLVSYQAQKALLEALDAVGDVMENLPTCDATPTEVKALVDKLQLDLKRSGAELEQEAKSVMDIASSGGVEVKVAVRVGR